MKRGTTIAIILVVPVLWFACTWKDWNPDPELEGRISDAVAAGGEFRMADCTGFAWDRVHVFQPYTSPADIEAALGFSWVGAGWTGIDSSDGAVLLVFVRDHDVVCYVMHPRGWGDFTYTHAPNAGLTPSDAVFAVTDEGDGMPRVALAARPP
jgi:hypothetical protein